MAKPTKPKPINWVAIRAEYEAGGVTLQQLADRLGVSRKTVERRSSKELWRQGVRKVSQEVSDRVSETVREHVVAQRVKKALTDLDMINSVIASTYGAIAENPDNFKTSGEAIAALDRMLKTKLEFSDEHIQKWLLDKGYVAVPIAEFAPSSEDSESEGKQENGSQCEAIALDSIVARASEVEPTIIPTAQRDLSILIPRETGDRVQES